MLLRQVVPYKVRVQFSLILHVYCCSLLTLLNQPDYDLSSHRGVDRPFRVGSLPKLYKFAFPNEYKVDKSLQLCCRHELHLLLPEDDRAFSRAGLVHGDQVREFIEEVVPSSIRVEVPMRDVLSTPEGDMIVFLIVYCGERVQLTRVQADSYRDMLETEISKHLRLRENRKGRLVSRPFPYPLLRALTDEHNSN